VPPPRLSFGWPAHRNLARRVRMCANRIVAGARCSSVLLRNRPEDSYQFASAQHFHQLEGLAIAISWGFESPLPHHSTRPRLPPRPRSWQAEYLVSGRVECPSDRSESKGFILLRIHGRWHGTTPGQSHVVYSESHDLLDAAIARGRQLKRWTTGCASQSTPSPPCRLAALHRVYRPS